MKSINISCLGACCASSWSSYGLKQGIPWYFLCFSLFISILCLPVYEKYVHLMVWEHVVSSHGEPTALNRKSLSIFSSFFVNILSFCSCTSLNVFCLGAHCGSSWSIYGFKKGIPWHFLFLNIYINFMSPSL